jgi:hypothetical protein
VKANRSAFIPFSCAIMNEKDEQMDILNNQFRELIENEKDSSMKYFDQLEKYLRKKKKNKSRKKWIIICLLLFLSFFIIYFILSNDELSYNIYFLLLSFVRVILIKVRRIIIQIR